MKKKCLFVAALACAVMLTAGIASAQKTPVAGFSPSLANPQPVNDNVLTTDANRLIRWQGWLDVDAFSASVLEQMQKQLDAGTIQLGTFTINEEGIDAAVKGAAAGDPLFYERNRAILAGDIVIKNPKFYVWTYRHNYTDTGLYQLYVSVKGTITVTTRYGVPPTKHPYRDIQSLGYEFGPENWSPNPDIEGNFELPVEIWRGAVVRVNARGRLDTVGVMEEWDERDFGVLDNVAGVIPGTTLDNLTEDDVRDAPISDWEVAPALPACHNPGGLYIPLNATGPKYKVPVDRRPVGREIRIGENSVQKQTGEVQEEGRVRTLSYPQAKPSVAPRKRGHGK